MNSENIKGEVKKVKLRHVVIACAAVVLAFGVLGSVLVALGGGWSSGIHFGDYRNGSFFAVGKSYDIDDTKALDLSGITMVKISGVSDRVLMQQGEGSAHLKGTCTTTGDPVKLKVEKSGSTMIVEVVYPFANINNNNSLLTVTLPADYAGALQIHTVSGEVQASGMPQKLTSVDLSTVSGEVSFSSAAQQQVKVGTTSGRINLSSLSGDTAVNTVSGDVDASFTAAVKATVGTTSGSVNLGYDVAPAAIQVNTVSGRVSVALPQNASCDVRFQTVSGRMTSSHSGLNVEHAKDFDGKMGDGAQPLRVSTTSGDFTLSQK